MSDGVAFSPVHLRVSTGDAPLPVEIRDVGLRLVEHGLADREFLLPPAVYVVAVRPPGGQKVIETVDLTAGKDRSIELIPSAGTFAPKPRYAKAKRAPRRTRSIRLGMAPKPPDWSFRFFRQRGLAGAAADAAPSVRSVERTEDDSLSLLVEVPQPAVFFVQIARPGEIPLNVALPAAAGGAGNTARLVARDIAGSLYTAAYPAGGVAALAAQYLAAGDLREAGQLITGEEAQGLLYGKVSNPIGAAAGAYVLLRLGESERMHDWAENLARWFEWLPDGAVVAGERAATVGAHREALEMFLKTEERGLPMFTDGLSILVSRLRRYRRSDLLRTDLESALLDGAARLLARLEEWSPFVDWSAPTLTFRANVPSDPAGSQTSPSDMSGYGVFDVDAEGRLVAREPAAAGG
jgi:hypothetical protein